MGLNSDFRRYVLYIKVFNKKIALPQLRKESTIKILPGNANSKTYTEIIKDVLKNGKYIILAKDPTDTTEGRIFKTFKKYVRYIPEKIRTTLTPHHGKPP